MKIAYNPLSSPALSAIPAGSDIIFDLPGISIYTKGVRFKGTDTTYNVFRKHTSSGSGGYDGLVPVPSYTTTSIRYLREDGTWQIPTPQIISSTYTQLSNEDFNTLMGEGRWYFIPGSSTTTNGPSGVNSGAELYVGRNASGYRYQKVITATGIIWFRYWDSTSWTSWVRWYTDANTDQKVLQSQTTTSNFRPVVLGMTNNTNPNSLITTITDQVCVALGLYAQPSTASLFAKTFIGDLKGNADTSTSLGNVNVGSATLPVYFASGKPVACVASSLFSLLSNDTNQISITVAGQNRKLTVDYATRSNYAVYLSSTDTRSVNNTPAHFSSSARFEFKANSVDGLSDGGSYHGILHFKPYGGTTDFSGGQTHQLAFTDSGNLHIRTSTSSSAWAAWLKFLHTGNSSLTTNANDFVIKINNVTATIPTEGSNDGRYVRKIGDNMTGNLVFTNSSGIVQKSNTSSNYVSPIIWHLGTTAAPSGTYDAQIGWHNTGNTTGSITILPYKTTLSPWSGTAGLYIANNILKIDGKDVLHSGNYSSYFGYIGTTRVQQSSAIQALNGIASINGVFTVNAEADQTRLGFGGVHSVVFGEGGYAHRTYYFRPSYGSAGPTNTTVYIQSASAATSPVWTTTHSFLPDGTATHIGHNIAAGFKKNGSSDSYVLLGGGGHLSYSQSTSASTLVQRSSSGYIYGSYFNSAISDESLLDIGSVYVRNTSDTFVRRVSKSQFQNIISNKFVTIDTTQTITGIKTFTTQQKFNVAQGTSPFTVISSTLVSQLNSELLGSRRASQFVWFDTLANMQDYVSYVIGLVRLDSIGRHSCGRLHLARTNILYNSVYIDYDLGTMHGTAPYSVGGTVICYGRNYPVVIFSYGGIYYAGFKLYAGAAQEQPFIESSIRDIYPFIVGYYNNNTSSILNAEINNSISTTNRINVTYNVYGNFIGNSTSTSQLQTARNINGTSFNGTSDITTARWGYPRTLTLTGAVTGSVSIDGSGNVSLATTYQDVNIGNLDARYVNVTGDTMTGKLNIQMNSSSSQALSLLNSTDGWTYMTMGDGTTGARVAHLAWKTSTDGIIPANAFHIRPGGVNTIAAFTSGGVYLSQRLMIDTTGRCYPISTGGRRSGMYGVYDSYKIGHIWSMGTAFLIPEDGANFGNLYGLAYKHTNNTTGGTMAGGHQTVWCVNGVPKAALGESGIWTANGFYKAGSSNSYALLGGGSHLAIGNATGNIPINNGTINTNLSADMLDGLHSTNFARSFNQWSPGTDVTLTMDEYVAKMHSNLNFTAWGTSSWRHGWWYSGTDSISTSLGIIDLAGAAVYSNSFQNDSTSNYKTMIFHLRNGETYKYTSEEATVKSWVKYWTTSNLNPDNYVTALGTNGDYLTWTRDSVVNNILVPKAYKSDQLEAYTASNFTGGGHYVRAIRNTSGWTTRLYMGYYRDTTLQNTVQVSFADDAGEATYLTNGFTSAKTITWNCNAPDRVVYSEYGSSGRSVTNAPSGWNYGTLLHLGHSNYNGTTGNLNIQLMWDVAHNTLNGGTLWFRGRDSVNGWAKNWCKVITDQNYTSVLDSRYVTSLGTSGNYLTWARNGITNNITIPYAERAGQLSSYGQSPNNSHPGYGARIFYSWNIGQANNATTGYSNGITIGSNPGDTAYGFQIVQNMWDDRTYTRRYNQGWQTWKTLAWTSDILDPADYYWADIKVSTSSSTSTSPTFHTAYASNWFRTYGKCGWFSQDYGGGIYMIDSTWIRTYGSKDFYCDKIIQAGGRFYTGYDSGVTNSMSCSNWFRSNGQTGWINASYGGGIYQTNSDSVSIYGGKVLYNDGYKVWGIGGHNCGLKLYQASHIGINLANASYTWGIYSNSNGSMYIGRRNSNVNDASGSYYHVLTTSNIQSPGFYHSGIGSNSYVLLAGGSYKALSDFAKGNAGSSTQGVYVSNGNVTAMTYSLMATVNSGTIGRLAYYSSTTSISQCSLPLGNKHTPIYLDGGIPKECDYSFRGTSNQPVILVAGYFYRFSTTSTSWYFNGYKHSEISDPSFYVNYGVMRVTFPVANGVYFASAYAQGRRNFSGANTSNTQPFDGRNGDYVWRSEGSYWFNAFVQNSYDTGYLYVRAHRLANNDNDSWYTGEKCWKEEEDAIESVSFAIIGFINN